MRRAPAHTNGQKTTHHLTDYPGMAPITADDLADEGHPVILSPLIKIDKIATENEQKYTFFVTRPLVFNEVPANWAGTVYTSSVIRHVLRNSVIASPAARIVKLVPYKRTRIELSDGGELLVVMLPTDSAEQNVMFLLELNGRRALYTGDFTEYASVLRSSWLQVDLQPGSAAHIHTAFVDNTITNRATLPLADACRAIATIHAAHPHHRIRMPLPDVGCEDLLVALASQPHNFRLCVGTLRMSLLNRHGQRPNITGDKRRSQIIAVIDEPITCEQYEFYKRSRILTVRLVQQQLDAPEAAAAAAPAPKYHAALALYELNYAPHASESDRRQLLAALQPATVHGIHETAELADEVPSVMLDETLEEERRKERIAAEARRLEPYTTTNRHRLRDVFGENSEDNDDSDSDAAEVGGGAEAAAAVEKPTANQLAGEEEEAPQQSLQVSSSSASASATASSSWLLGSSRNSTEALFDSTLTGCSLGDHSRLLRRRPRSSRMPPPNSKLQPAKRPRVVYDD